MIFLSPLADLSARDGADRCVLGVSAGATGRPWKARLDGTGEREALQIAQGTGLPEIVARVLAGRNVSADDAEAFLEPSVRALMPDPSRLVDCEAAAARLATAVLQRERIAVFCDYDVDGATSGAVVIRTLRALGLDPAYHVPDRITEGYGPSVEGVRALVRGGASLIVTVDCGSAAHAPLEEARKLGADVVVIDHHPVGPDLAPATAIVNPRRQDDLSGLGYLAAVGVAFVVMAALLRRLRADGAFSEGRRAPDLLALLDLVALGTVCDVVPLTGLNRALVLKGLKVMSGRSRPGLVALSDVARLSGPPSPYHLGFLLGPRINAGGRIGDAGLGLRLLLSEDPAEAARIAAVLDGLNGERQALESAALDEAEATLLPRVLADALPPILEVASADWHPGVVGLVAARLKERHRRPAFAIAIGPDGRGTGSGRSIPGVDLGAAVREAVAAGLLEKGGGHAMAAGLTVTRERIDALAAFLSDRLSADVAAARATDALTVDGTLTAEGATEELLDLVERAGPFGAGHPEPVFALPAHVVRHVAPCGTGHLRLDLASPAGGRIEAMAFRAADTDLGALLDASRGAALHFAGSLMKDTFRGTPRIKLRVLDAARPVA